jgi:hypothetical protein
MPAGLPFVIRTLVKSRRVTAMALVGRDIQNKPGIGADGFT